MSRPLDDLSGEEYRRLLLATATIVALCHANAIRGAEYCAWFSERTTVVFPSVARYG